MTTIDLLPQLANCYVHVALKGSQFDEEACGKQGIFNSGSDIQVHIMHPTASAARMVVGNILTGEEDNFLVQLSDSIQDAQEAAEAIKANRELLQQNRVIRRRQEAELLLSEQEDQRKHAEETQESQNETVADDDEVRRKRLLALDAQVGTSKRPREESSVADDSGTVRKLFGIQYVFHCLG